MFYDDNTTYRTLPWSSDALKNKAIEVGQKSRVVMVSFGATGIMLYTPEAKSFYFSDTKLCKQLKQAFELFMESKDTQMALDLTYGGTGMLGIVPVENVDGYWEQENDKYKYLENLSTEQKVDSNPFIRKQKAEGEAYSDVPAQGKKKPKVE